jgi:hypothetical protein
MSLAGPSRLRGDSKASGSRQGSRRAGPRSSAVAPTGVAAAQRLWNDGHRRHAVAAAAEAVSGQMKQLTDRNDAPDTSLWQQAFSKDEPLEGKPRLRWPGDTSDQDVKMNGRRNTQRDQRRQGHAATYAASMARMDGAWRRPRRYPSGWFSSSRTRPTPD